MYGLRYINDDINHLISEYKDHAYVPLVVGCSTRMSAVVHGNEAPTTADTRVEYNFTSGTQDNMIYARLELTVP